MSEPTPPPPAPAPQAALLSASPPDAPPPAPPGAPTWSPPKRHPLVWIGIAAVAVCAVLVVLAAWDLPPFRGGAERTDNAYIRGRTTVIAPQVSGYVGEVLVHDYQRVTAGQVLAKIDDRTYRAKVEQARANLDAAIANLKNNDQARAQKLAQLAGQEATNFSARAQRQRSAADMARAGDLVTDGSISVRERDQTLAQLRESEAQVRQTDANIRIAREDVRSTEVQRLNLAAQVESARAQLHAAEIDLGHTVIVAPEAGQLGEVGTRIGVYVTNGTQLMSLVPPDRWIIANYKEAQTAFMKPGQKASFTVDALDGQRLEGRVEILSPATGSEFAVLKPDNATGNFVKVPQRIGVRIGIDANQALMGRLRPGMSVEVRIDTNSEPARTETNASAPR